MKDFKSLASTLFFLYIVMYGHLGLTTCDAQEVNAGSNMRKPTSVDDEQRHSDVDAFADEMYAYGDHPSPVIADRVLRRALENNNDAEMLYWASRALMKGWTSTSTEDGVKLLQRAAEEGYKPAIRDLAFLESLGLNDVVKDEPGGMQKLSQIAESGDPRALYFLGVIYANGSAGKKADSNLAEQYLKKALDAVYLPAAEALADFFAIKDNAQESEKYRIQAAEYGDTDAMRILVDPSHSTATSRDPAQVIRYLSRGVIWRDEQLTRMFSVGLLLKKNTTGPDDYVVQFLLQTAANNGDRRAMALQGRARLQGLWYSTRDPVRGRRELQFLADGADPSGSAAFLLGQALWEGAGLEPDAKEAVKLIMQSANAGFAPAKSWLADHNQNDQPAASGATTYPSAPAEYEAAMTSLHSTLLDDSTAIDDTSSRPPGALLMKESDQVVEDNDEILDTLYHQSYPVMRATAAREVRRANEAAASSRTKTWAAFAIIQRWCNGATPDQACKWLHEAADAEDPIAMSLYGRLLLNGDLIPRNVPEGLKWIERAHEKGDLQAAVELGTVYLAGLPGADKDIQKGLAYLEEAHQKGSIQGLWALTKFYFDIGDPSHFYPLLLEGATRLFSPSLSLLSWELNGQVPPPKGSPQFTSNNAWLTIFLRGTLTGNPTTETYAAVHMGEQNPPDRYASYLLLRRAATAGCVQAQAILADVRITGTFSITPDINRGQAELERLATIEPTQEQLSDSIEPLIGRAEAQWRLGEHLYEGKYIPSDVKRGEDLIRHAAAGHNPQAIKWLAEHEGSQAVKKT